MNKKGGWVLSSFIVLSLLTTLVSAQGQLTPLQNLFNDGWTLITNILYTVFQPILGGPALTSIAGTPVSPGELLFVKLLFVFIVFFLTWSIMKFVPLIQNNKFVGGVISAAVAILGVRFFLTAGWIETLLLPYNVYGLAVVVLLPLMLYFFLLEKGFEGAQYAFLRKTGWIFAAVAFLGIMMSRWLGGVLPMTGLIIYWVAIIACIAFFWFDKTIQAAWARNRTDQLVAIADAETRAQVQRQINLLRNDVYGNPATGYAAIYVIGPDGKVNDPMYKARRNALLGMATLHNLKKAVDSLPEAA